ncbi:DUF861 domain-containing protein [Epibacterium ulvae]|uniref:cupin domain-containing protein n=1 Tax=Epibacterium ulvae TaxID=1156985 RepID=UPI001BFBF6C6|nr:cupin domain-containing protein [Epibacterium ulvae]MBT8154071.1 DUF861 domain-containing protein [Epibacterium ulvae]
MSFIKFVDQNPDAVEKNIQDDILEGNPKQFSWMMYDGHQQAIRSGIWDSTAGKFTAVMDGIVEFCHILQGSATIKTSDGNSYDVAAGDAFVMNAGLETEWTVDNYIKKHFVIVSVDNLPPHDGK